MMRRALVGITVIFSLNLASLIAVAEDRPWETIVENATGQTVYWHAWGGDESVNQYIDWVAVQVADAHDITLRHIKVGNISESVALLVAENIAGRTSDGRIDLMWVNGENFAALKRGGLLYGPFTQLLPAFASVDTINKPTTLVDFTVPTDGLEAPWGMAQLVFFADTSVVQKMPQSSLALKTWIETHPGGFTYPAPPDFTGTTFLKQVLLDLTEDRAPLFRPATQVEFDRITAPLWAYLESIRPHLWRSGRIYPANYPSLRQLMNDGEIDIAFSFNPAEVSSAVSRQMLPETTRPFVLDGGTIGNTHFVAIPKSAASKDGALVVANFLLSPAAQARKADPHVWGDPTVLDLSKLNDEDVARFSNLADSDLMLDPEALRKVLPEPHPSWTEMLEEEWQRRYHR